MENKVIVDDVDVSECSYYCKENEPYGCEIWDNECEAQNCYFKQFKRLERQYADVLKLAKENADSNEYCLQELEQENKRLKEEKGGMQILIDNYIALTEKYSQALQEIREIVSEPCIVDENCQTCNSGCMQKDILAKINEVIGVE